METGKSYSQLRAFWGILRASLIASFRNVSGLVFGLVFPLIFILVFGFIGSNGGTLEVAVQLGTSTDNPVISALEQIESVKLSTDLTQEQITDRLSKGQLAGEIAVFTPTFRVGRQQIEVKVTTSAASQGTGKTLEAMVSGIVDRINLSTTDPSALPIQLDTNEIQGRQFTSIDFVLPGQLGFSLLTSGIFATAFLFLTLKQTLVLKRFFATPVKRGTIIMGEGVSRLIFALFQALVIIGVGVVAFDYTLIHGWITLLQMLALSGIGLLVFLGFGFVISSIAKDERTVPPFAQLISLPQFLLAGTFFPIDIFPAWLQPIARAMPLTFLNDAMRKVAFEGDSLLAVGHDIGYLLLWGLGAYILAIRLFKWE